MLLTISNDIQLCSNCYKKKLNPQNRFFPNIQMHWEHCICYSKSKHEDIIFSFWLLTVYLTESKENWKKKKFKKKIVVWRSASEVIH